MNLGTRNEAPLLAWLVDAEVHIWRHRERGLYVRVPSATGAAVKF